MKKLNLGCGNRIRKGWVNVDVAPLLGVDVVHDLNQIPFPFETASCDEIICEDVLEHVNYIAALRECHRLLVDGGTLHIEVPHFTSSNNFVDPTHLRQFSVKTFNFFCKGTVETDSRGYYFDFAFSHIRRREIQFHKTGIFAFNWPISVVVNASYRFQTLYEATGLSRLFPAETLCVDLVK